MEKLIRRIYRLSIKPEIIKNVMPQLMSCVNDMIDEIRVLTDEKSIPLGGKKPSGEFRSLL